MPELDQMSPEMEPTQPEMGAPVMGLEPGQTDEEGAMAKADLYKLANYSFKLFKKLEDNAQLEGWVQAKITKAADYIASVYHYLEYEMEFSQYGHKLDNSDVMNESQKVVFKNKLMEAKAKLKALKVTQAEKAKDKKVSEGVLNGGEESCTECGGTGMVYREATPVPDHVKGKVEKYNRQAKAFHAASKRLDRNKNGIPDSLEKGGEELTAEETSSTGGEITRGKGFTRHSHNPKRFTDEPHTEPKSKAQSKSAAEKAGDKAADKQTEKDSKSYEKRFPGSVTKVSAGKKVDPNAKKEKEEEVDETQGSGGHSFGQGVYEAKSKKAKKDYDKDGKIESEKDEVIGSRRKAAGLDEAKFDPLKHVKNPTKGEKTAAKDVKRGSYGDRAALLKSAEKEDRLKEASTGDYSAKKAAAGKDIGKPGKNFAKIEKSAGGGEKGKKIAGAVLKNLRGKNESYVAQAVAEAKKGKKPDFLDMDKDGDKKEPMKKAVADKKEVVKESADLARMKEFLTRLNG
jgi:hypothetical protein